MPRKPCTARPTRHHSHQRARAHWWTLALAALSIVCAGAEAWWMSGPWT